jgi:hypothetical protein
LPELGVAVALAALAGLEDRAEAVQRFVVADMQAHRVIQVRQDYPATMVLPAR